MLQPIRRTGRKIRNKTDGGRRRPVFRFLAWALKIGAALAVVVVLSIFGFRKIRESCLDLEILKINTVKIEGMSAMDSTQLGRMVNIVPGTPVLAVPFARIKREIRAGAWISHTSFGFRWPNTLVVTVTEREPIAYMNIGTVFLIDREGYLLPVGAGTCRNVPMVCGLTDTVRDDSGLKKIDRSQVMRISRFFDQIEFVKKKTGKILSQIEFCTDATAILRFESFPTLIQVKETQLDGDLGRFEQIMALVEHDTAALPKFINLSYTNVAFVQ